MLQNGCSRWERESWAVSVLAATGTSGRAAVLGLLGFLALVVLDSSGSSELLLWSS